MNVIDLIDRIPKGDPERLIKSGGCRRSHRGVTTVVTHTASFDVTTRQPPWYRVTIQTPLHRSLL
jgi:hypothetical protein